jgi:hypothetical protein
MAEKSPLILALTSGLMLKVREVKLYDETLVREVALLRSRAAASLGGVSTGVGFLGSPGWALGGAAALGVLEGLLSSGMRKQGLKLLQEAQDKSVRLVEGGLFFDTTQLIGTEHPYPEAWSVIGPKTPGSPQGRRYIHNGDEFLRVRTEAGQLAVRWSLVAAVYPPQDLPATSTKVELEPIPDDDPGKLETYKDKSYWIYRDGQIWGGPPSNERWFKNFPEFRDWADGRKP